MNNDQSEDIPSNHGGKRKQPKRRTPYGSKTIIRSFRFDDISYQQFEALKHYFERQQESSISNSMVMREVVGWTINQLRKMP